jgi:hypothetical protein
MRPIAFLSLEDPTGYVIDEDVALPTLEAAGFAVETVPWTQQTDWSRFEAAVIRSTWDYQQQPARFLEVLEAVSAATHLANPLEVVRWNIDKIYLKELEAAGVPVVPTAWDPDLDDLGPILDRLETRELILKPSISANADHTYRVPEGRVPEGAREALAGRTVLAQPFLETILDEGEHSLFYFAGELSHAVNKRPKPRDFRVQEEHGGIITSVSPDDALRAAGDRVIAALPHPVLYARVDLVQHRGEQLLIEVELIEPALYFRTHEDAPANFTRALQAWLAE